jgi:hypothetical protein
MADGARLLRPVRQALTSSTHQCNACHARVLHEDALPHGTVRGKFTENTPFWIAINNRDPRWGVYVKYSIQYFIQNPPVQIAIQTGVFSVNRGPLFYITTHVDGPLLFPSCRRSAGVNSSRIFRPTEGARLYQSQRLLPSNPSTSSHSSGQPPRPEGTSSIAVLNSRRGVLGFQTNRNPQLSGMHEHDALILLVEWCSFVSFPFK